MSRPFWMSNKRESENKIPCIFRDGHMFGKKIAAYFNLYVILTFGVLESSFSGWVSLSNCSYTWWLPLIKDYLRGCSERGINLILVIQLPSRNRRNHGLPSEHFCKSSFLLNLDIIILWFYWPKIMTHKQLKSKKYK